MPTVGNTSLWGMVAIALTSTEPSGEVTGMKVTLLLVCPTVREPSPPMSWNGPPPK